MVCKSEGVATPTTANSGGIRPVRGARATGVREELDERNEEGAGALWVRNTLRETPSWLVSMIFHMIVLLVLAMWALPTDLFNSPVDLEAAKVVEPPDLEQLPDDTPEPPVLKLAGGYGDPNALTSLVDIEPEKVAKYEPVVDSTTTVRIGMLDISGGLRFGDPLAKVGPGGDGNGRIEGYIVHEDKPEGLAVAAALKWLAAHQLADGSWCFDHTHAAGCGGKCPNAGKLAEARIGATSIALLPFFGAGQTQHEGMYKKTVERGLAFLGSQIDVDPKTGSGSFYEPGGRMYSHGLAAIALCEAYGMTRDKRLHTAAQAAIDFTCLAQDPVGGGWRYEKQQRGDTSAVGWQIMALKSAHMAYLRVPPITIKKAFRFLDTVQYESGAKYGYIKSGQGSQATTAIGLLCRMYLGWQKDNPALIRGVQGISDQGPTPGDMYYNYYATQVMRHWGGPLWKKWDKQMLPLLLDSQAKAGHETGSWFFKHNHSDRGGRLYCTAMATMTLEVYYRISPIYGNQSIEDNFPE